MTYRHIAAPKQRFGFLMRVY